MLQRKLHRVLEELSEPSLVEDDRGESRGVWTDEELRGKTALQKVLESCLEWSRKGLNKHGMVTGQWSQNRDWLKRVDQIWLPFVSGPRETKKEPKPIKREK